MPSSFTPMVAQSSVEASLINRATVPLPLGGVEEATEPLAPPPQARPSARAVMPKADKPREYSGLGREVMDSS